MQRKSFADMTCPIARSLEHVGEWWSMLILRDAFGGTTRFAGVFSPPPPPPATPRRAAKAARP